MMIKKKYIAILLFLVIFAMTISQVSAVEVNATDEIASDVADNEIIGDIANGEISTDISDNEKLSNVESEEIAVSDENESVSVDGYGTYTELNNLIKNSASSITLYKDYMYDPDVDGSTLESGFAITKNFGINGNGHTIYGNGARLATVDSSSILIITNLKFINNYDADAVDQVRNGTLERFGSGGAIFNKGILMMTNCVFSLNCAKWGGAIYSAPSSGIIITKCNFTNNSAISQGGAIFNDGITLIQGGDTYTDFCWFEDNCADVAGGAIATANDLYVKKSVFFSNYAGLGGAIFNDDYNSSHISESYFFSNSAETMGGAVIRSIVVDCYFDKTNMVKKYENDYYGHDMCLGVKINSTSEDTNSKNFVAVVETAYLVTTPKTLSYAATKGKKFEVRVTDAEGENNVSRVKIRLIIEGAPSNYTAITDKNGIASFTLPELSDGNHKVTVELYNFETSTTYTMKVGKNPTTIQFDKEIIKYYYGNSGTTTVTVTGGTIRSASVVGHSTANVKISGKVVTVSGLAPGKYTLSVVSNPDSSHDSSVNSIGINVLKRNAAITAKAFNTYYGNGKTWSVTLKDTTGKKAISGAQINLKIYTGYRYKNYKVKTNSRGVATFKASTLNPGTHKVIVSYSNSKYNCKAVTTSLKIKKIPLTYRIHSKEYNDGTKFEVWVKNKATGKSLKSGVTIKLLIYTGGSYKTVPLKTGNYNSYSGYLCLATNKFSAGSHKVVLKPGNSKYSGTKNSNMYIKPVATKQKKMYMTISNGKKKIS